jgi:mevalonate kinase
MLFGEHAVLHGSRAIVTAIERYITVVLTPRTDQIININSDLLGKRQFRLSELFKSGHSCHPREDGDPEKYKSLDSRLRGNDTKRCGNDTKMRGNDEQHAFTITSPWQFVLTVIADYIKDLSSGFDLDIKSDFTDKIGFGSSAAVTVATLSVLDKWLNHGRLEPLELVKIARKVVQKVQGTGSGADVAASVFGKTILYQMEPLNITELAHNPPLTMAYSGVKTATSKVVRMVEEKRLKNMDLFTNLYAAIDCCVNEAVPAINRQDWPRVGELMNIHQGLQDALGVNNKALSELIFSLRKQPDIYGAKISGAGLGDCVIGVGKDTSRN